MFELLFFIAMWVAWCFLPPEEKKKTFDEEKREVLREGYFEN